MRVVMLLLGLLLAVEAKQQVVGFLAESVTLFPDLGQSLLNPSSIKWLILPNDTWIATYQRGQTKMDHFWRYSGRLLLDKQTGALTINNLDRQDAMQYVLEADLQGGHEITHKVDLRVETRLQPPNVTSLNGVLVNRSCFAVLHCWSPDPHANFTWSAHPSADHHTVTSWLASHSAFLLVKLESDRKVRFTCNTTNMLESVAGALEVECGGGETTPESAEMFGQGIAVGSFLVLLLAVVTYICRDNIQDVVSRLKDKERR